MQCVRCCHSLKVRNICQRSYWKSFMDQTIMNKHIHHSKEGDAKACRQISKLEQIFNLSRGTLEMFSSGSNNCIWKKFKSARLCTEHFGRLDNYIYEQLNRQTSKRCKRRLRYSLNGMRSGVHSLTVAHMFHAAHFSETCMPTQNQFIPNRNLRSGGIIGQAWDIQ